MEKLVKGKCPECGGKKIWQIDGNGSCYCASRIAGGTLCMHHFKHQKSGGRKKIYKGCKHCKRKAINERSTLCREHYNEYYRKWMSERRKKLKGNDSK